eukprot:199047_1
MSYDLDFELATTFGRLYHNEILRLTDYSQSGTAELLKEFGVITPSKMSSTYKYSQKNLSGKGIGPDGWKQFLKGHAKWLKKELMKKFPRNIIKATGEEHIVELTDELSEKWRIQQPDWPNRGKYGPVFEQNLRILLPLETAKHIHNVLFIGKIKMQDYTSKDGKCFSAFVWADPEIEMFCLSINMKRAILFEASLIKNFDDAKHFCDLFEMNKIEKAQKILKRIQLYK